MTTPRGAARRRTEGSLAILLALTTGLAAQTSVVLDTGFAGAELDEIVSARSLHVVDLDLDGRDDLFAMGTDSLWSLRNTGEGGMQALALPHAGGTLERAATLDWNGDGFPDLAFLNENDELFVMTTDGTGAKLAELSIVVPPDLRTQIVAGDLNGDGHDDILLSEDSPPQRRVLLGDGSGGVQSSFFTPIPMKDQRLALLELDGDGVLDLASFSGTNFDFHLVTERGLGDASFAPLSDTLLGNYCQSFAFGDVDDDGDPDISYVQGQATIGFWDVHTRLNLGDGSYSAVTSSVEANTDTVLLADFDGDGFDDLLTAIGFASKARHYDVHLSEGDGLFRGPFRSRLGSSHQRPVALHLDGDGLLDVASPAGGVVLNTGTGTGQFATAFLGEDFSRLAGLALGDLDGDGELDAVGVDENFDDVVVALGTPGERFAPLVAYDTSESITDAAVGDLTQDGWPDVVSAVNDTEGGILLLENDGTGALLAPVALSTGGGRTEAVELSDVNGDGELDVLAINLLNSRLAVLLADGMGGLLPPRLLMVGASPREMAVGDLDGDGLADVVVASTGPGVVDLSVFHGNAVGGLAPSAPIPVGEGVDLVRLGDVDGDNDLDIMVNEVFGSELEVYLNDGAGHFSIGFGLEADDALYDANVGDVNGDGVTDVLASGINALLVFEGSGAGSFVEKRRYAVGGDFGALTDLLLVDLEGSGADDALMTSLGGDLIVLSTRFSPWTNVGGGVPGGPQAVFTGPLTADSIVHLEVSDGDPSGLLWLALGLDAGMLPLGDSLLVPQLDLLKPLPLDPEGKLSIDFAWPAGLPAELPFWVQPWRASPKASGDASLGVTR